MNKEVIALTAKWVMENPQLHNQGTWMSGKAIPLSNGALLEAGPDAVCGSTGCVAGWGALIAGYHQTAFKSYRWNEKEAKEEEVWLGEEDVVDELGNLYSMSEAARRAFGLSYDQAETMFNGNRSRVQLKTIFDAIAESDDPDELDFDLIIEDISNRNNDEGGCDCSECQGQ